MLLPGLQFKVNIKFVTKRMRAFVKNLDVLLLFWKFSSVISWRNKFKAKKNPCGTHAGVGGKSRSCLMVGGQFPPGPMASVLRSRASEICLRGKPHCWGGRGQTLSFVEMHLWFLRGDSHTSQDNIFKRDTFKHTLKVFIHFFNSWSKKKIPW